MGRVKEYFIELEEKGYDVEKLTADLEYDEFLAELEKQKQELKDKDNV